MHFYVAGAMTGIKGFNFQAFVDADEVLHASGHTTFNPAVHEIEQGIVPWPEILEMSGDHQELADMGHEFDMSKALRRDMNAIAEADGIVLLDGWANSSGAVTETAAAIWSKKRVFGLSQTPDEGWQLYEFDTDELYYFIANFFLNRMSDEAFEGMYGDSEAMPGEVGAVNATVEILGEEE